MRRMALGLAAAVIAGVVGFAGAAQAGLVTSLALTDAYSGTGDYLQQGNVQWDITATCGATNCSQLYATIGGNGIAISSGTSEPISSIVSGGDFSVTFEEYALSGGFTSASFSSIGGSGTGVAQIFDNSSGNYINNNDPALSTIGNSASGKPSTISFATANDILFAIDTKNAVGLQSVSVGQPVPEPGSAGLVGFGLLALASIAYRTRRGFRA